MKRRSCFHTRSREEYRRYTDGVGYDGNTGYAVIACTDCGELQAIGPSYETEYESVAIEVRAAEIAIKTIEADDAEAADMTFGEGIGWEIHDGMESGENWETPARLAGWLARQIVTDMIDGAFDAYVPTAA